MAQTQNQRIKEYLENGHKLTPLEALNLFGCFRLASRISDLKRQGMNIKTEMVTDSNTGKQYASYSLVLDVSSIENDVKDLENDLNKIAEKHVGEEYTEELKEKLNSEIVKTVLEKISDQTEIPMECLVEINSDGELF